MPALRVTGVPMVQKRGRVVLSGFRNNAIAAAPSGRPDAPTCNPVFLRCLLDPVACGDYTDHALREGRLHERPEGRNPA